MTPSRRFPEGVYLALGLLLIVGACGPGDDADTGIVPLDGTASDPQWVEQALEGAAGFDQREALGVHGDQAAVALISEEGVITGSVAQGNGQFEAGEPTATGSRYLTFDGVASLGDRWIALGSGGPAEGDEPSLEVGAFYSDDGRTWSEADTTGIDGSADVYDLTIVDEGLVAVGAAPVGSGIPMDLFRPVAWHSEDGETWTMAPLPTDGDTEEIDGAATAAVMVGEGRTIAVGHVGGESAVWSSTDNGRSWTLDDPTGIPAATSLSDVAVQDEAIVASGLGAENDDGYGQTPVILLSTDGGDSWQAASAPPPGDPDAGYAMSLFAGGGRFFALNDSYVDAWTEPQQCYADIEICRQDLTTTLYASQNGDHWSRVATPAMAEFESITSVAATDEGRVVLLSRAESGVNAWTWPAGAPLPTEDEPADPATEVDMLDEGEDPEIGRRYGLPLFIHCGMDWLYVGDEAWKRIDNEPNIETGAGDNIPEAWPVAQETIFGFVALVQEDLIEYSVGEGDEAEVIATYAPATEEPPGCD